MKWSLQELSKYRGTPLEFDETLDVAELLRQKDSMIQNADPVRVVGFIAPSEDSYILHYKLETILDIPSTRSLELVRYPLSFSVDELFMTPEQFQKRSDEVEAHDVLLIETQTIDLDESVADNIVLSIPLQILTEEEQEGKELPSGQGWTVLSQEQYQEEMEQEQETKVDPRLAKLSDLFKEDNE